MAFLLSSVHSESPLLSNSAQQPENLSSDQVFIQEAFQLLDVYLETEESSPLMPLLRKVREHFLEDLDGVQSVKEVYGLLYWLMADNGVDNRGESLDDTAERLGDLDIDNGTDLYTDLIFHLKDAVERLYDLEQDL